TRFVREVVARVVSTYRRKIATTAGLPSARSGCASGTKAVMSSAKNFAIPSTSREFSASMKPSIAVRTASAGGGEGGTDAQAVPRSRRRTIERRMAYSTSLRRAATESATSAPSPAIIARFQDRQPLHAQGGARQPPRRCRAVSKGRPGGGGRRPPLPGTTVLHLSKDLDDCKKT